MKLGVIIESAVWLDGRETAEDRERFEEDVRNAIHTVCTGEGWLHTPVKFAEKHPFDDDVPDVPDHVQGYRVRLLIGAAEVTGKAPESKPDSFVANLDRKDLVRLRRMTRDAHAKSMYGDWVLSDRECDKVIEECGPEAALAALREHTVH